jgi:8-oxo-dGTP diphosphatase
LKNEKILIVKALVINKDKLLLLKKVEGVVGDHSGKWEAPGGKIELDENPDREILREVFEETGHKGKIIRKLSSWTWELEDIGGEADVYLVEIDSQKVKLSNEHSEFIWINPEDMEKMENLIFKNKFIEYLREANLI